MTVLKYLLSGVSNIINQNKATSDASILASIQELKNTVEFLGSEVFALHERLQPGSSNKSTNKQLEKRSITIDLVDEDWVASEEYGGNYQSLHIIY